MTGLFIIALLIIGFYAFVGFAPDEVVKLALAVFWLFLGTTTIGLIAWAMIKPSL